MLQIRPIRADEGARLRAIRLEALAESPTAFGSTFAETLVRPREYWERRAAENAAGTDSVMFVATDDDRWIGLAGSYREGGSDPATATLISMWVNPRYRNRGLGRALVQQVVAWARMHGAACVELWVTEGNEAAGELYRQCGFSNTGATQPHPSNPALRERQMSLTLP